MQVEQALPQRTEWQWYCLKKLHGQWRNTLDWWTLEHSTLVKLLQHIHEKMRSQVEATVGLPMRV
jgi:hypothetical protein